MRLFFSIWIVALGLSGTAFGSVIYNESSYPGGDFPGSGFPNIGTLGAGLNTISGNVSGAPGQRRFRRYLQRNATGGLVHLLRPVCRDKLHFCTAGGSCFAPNNSNGSLTEPLNLTTVINGNGSYNLTLNAPYSTSGNLNIDIKSPYRSQSVPGVPPFNDGNFAYTLEYTVSSASSVPEPGTTSSLVIGLLGVGAMWVRVSIRRRRELGQPKL